MAQAEGVVVEGRVRRWRSIAEKRRNRRVDVGARRERGAGGESSWGERQPGIQVAARLRTGRVVGAGCRIRTFASGNAVWRDCAAGDLWIHSHRVSRPRADQRGARCGSGAAKRFWRACASDRASYRHADLDRCWRDRYAARLSMG